MADRAIVEAAAERRTPVTILVSVDGLRPDALGRGNTPTLDALARQGVSAEMRPSFPTNTFPNHYTLVTGLRPDRHGVVDNTMEDQARPGIRFRLADPKQTRDAFWWNGAEPIWVSAERAGILTGTMFWPGSEAPIRGVRPSAWFPYDAAITSGQRVRTVLDWLRRPAAERPRLLTLYFDVVDKASHEVGYASPEERSAVREIDGAIAGLRNGLATMRQPVQLIVVSDHGMAAIPADNLLDPDDVVDEASARTIFAGGTLSVFPNAGAERTVTARALMPRAHQRCYRREDLPARFAFGRHPRVPPLLCLAEVGWRYAREVPRRYLKGEHGYDPAHPSMRAMFIAHGPGFRVGARLPVFDNVDVYPLLRDLIGLPPATGLDGNAVTLESARRR